MYVGHHGSRKQSLFGVAREHFSNLYYLCASWIRQSFCLMAKKNEVLLWMNRQEMTKSKKMDVFSRNSEASAAPRSTHHGGLGYRTKAVDKYVAGNVNRRTCRVEGQITHWHIDRNQPRCQRTHRRRLCDGAQTVDKNIACNVYRGAGGGNGRSLKPHRRGRLGLEGGRCFIGVSSGNGFVGYKLLAHIHCVNMRRYTRRAFVHTTCNDPNLEVRLP